MRHLLRPLLAGAKSLVPFPRRPVEWGGSDSARYCYTVWLRHLAVLREAGAPAPGGTVVEFGPGDSQGIGLAALLTGARQTVGLDVGPFASPAASRAVLDGLVALFRDDAPAPGDDEFPLVRPRLDRLPRPSELVDPASLAAALTPARVADIARALADPGPAAAGDGPVAYAWPWSPASVAPGSADLVVSQAVLEYLPHEPGNDRLDQAFGAMRQWLRPGGLLSHQIDLRSPFGPEWNAHWAVGDALWRVVRGRRPIENRAPRSAYLALCARHGFEVLAALATPAPPGVPAARLAPRFAALPAADHAACGLHLVARAR
jgi:SAM-dependent methyltransferase